MDEDKLPATLRMLVDRMKEHPKEFVNSDWNPISFNAWEKEPFEDVRWGNLIRAMLTSGRELMFDDEEVDYIKFHYKQLLRQQIDGCIVKELIGGEKEKEIDFKERQMDLPYMSQSTILRKTK